MKNDGKKVKLSAALIEAFAGAYLSPRYDDAAPTPPFHREVWELYSSDYPSCGCVAPRSHAKSTAFTFDYIMAEMCFRTSDYCILLGSTEDKAAEQLSNIAEELRHNEMLRQDFGIQGFESDTKTDIIVTCDDGHRFRIMARGAEQKIRGAMWKGKRPNLIVGDDVEDDEQVENKNRREKFRKWFFRAAKQALSQNGKMRIHGTILHEDSLLSRLNKNSMWRFKFYQAHRSYDDFSNILWPQRWSEEKLRMRQREFEEDGDATGYAQEFLNDPYDRSDSYLKGDSFLPMSQEDRAADMLYYVGCDFAVSKHDHANRTSFTVGGTQVGGPTCIVKESVDRWDTLEWIMEMFYLQKRWNPQVWFVEGGQIWNAVKPLLYQEMLAETRSPPMVEAFGTKDIYLNLEVLNPVKDKGVRGRSFQKRMKAGTLRFDTEAEWFPSYKEECLRFTGVAQAKLDDQFDSTATLCMGLDKLPAMEEEDLDGREDEDDEELSFLRREYNRESRSHVTGY